MITSISIEAIEKQLLQQLSSFFFLSEEDEMLINIKWGVISRCEYCFSRTKNKYYSCDGETYFNPYQSAQYTIFLYFFANTISQDTDNRLLADKLYYLNKIMNGCDLYHEVNLPHYLRWIIRSVALWDGLNMVKDSVLGKIARWETIKEFIRF